MPSPSPLSVVLSRLSDFKAKGDHHQARCPAHQDTSPSLSITAAPDGKVLLHCFTGCTVEAICAAIGLKPADLFPHDEKQGARETRYVIKDIHGGTVAVHVRKDLPDGSKAFHWETPDGKMGLGGKRVDSVPLYRSEKLALTMTGETVYVTEGEKAADALGTLGVTVTATTCGANACPTVATLKPYAKYHLVLWPDNDDAGRKHMQAVARAAVEAGATVQIIAWHAARQKEDAADFVLRGNSAAELAKLPRVPFSVDDAWQADLSDVMSGGDEEKAFPAPEVHTEPSGRVVVTWSDQPVRVLLDQLDKRRDGLHCFFSAQRKHGDAWRWLSPRTRQNLYSVSAKEGLVRELDLAWSVRWKDRVKQTVIAAMEAMNQSTPVVTLADEADPGERVNLLYPMLETGQVTILFADGGTGKSLFAMACACSLALGMPFIPGLNPARQTAVLYLDWETSGQEQRRRMGQIIAGSGAGIPRNLFYRRMSGPLHDSIEQLREFILVNKIGLVIADSAGYATDGDINDASVALTFAAAVRALEVTALVIAHVPREKENRDRPIGSTYFHNMARSTWLLVKEQDSTQTSVHLGLVNKKSNNGPIHSTMAFRVDFSDNAVRYYRADPQATPAISANTSEAEQVASVLKHGHLTVFGILDELGLPKSKAGQIRKTLARRRDMFQRHETDSDESLWGLNTMDARHARQENNSAARQPRGVVNLTGAATAPLKGGGPNASPLDTKEDARQEDEQLPW